ncbi:unnamed protein product [Adineta steineri]|uniref:VWFA domain-containing protein n=1 Tax=Adineta steineri TaxID=433720 RepID=A0A814X013_9BILA|nr:unnamed protein product [Adineta steineri]CAF1106370.1 unnamed protein product [Adineta steineri]CAF1209053.1 unnamed protein product [Adineta steineri]
MLTGVLVDVSGSMKNSLQSNVTATDQQITRAESIFRTIMNITKREVNCCEEQEIFTLAFGLQDVSTCDLLSLLDYVKTLNEPTDVDGHESLIQLLANNGAPRAGEYVRKYLTKNEALFLYNFYSEDTPKLTELVERLPVVCKETPNLIHVASQARSHVESSIDRQFGSTSDTAWLMKAFFKYYVCSGFEVIAALSTPKETALQGGLKVMDIGSKLGICSDSTEVEREATREQANRAMKYARNQIRIRTIPKLREISRPVKKTLESTINLLQEVAGTSPSHNSSQTKDNLSAAELSLLVDSIEPYIYGNTPMCEALESALDMFRSATHSRKVLFLLSDGEATDGDPVPFAQQLRENGVLVFICLLTSENIPHPKALYYEPDPQWTEAQRAMFELSSTVENTHSAMSVLLEQNWKLAAAGKSRLFVQVNHPTMLDEFSNLVRRITESNDALLNIFGRVSLDMYINISNSSFEPKLQQGGTCYANAVTTVLHLAMRRIEGREGGTPDFEVVRGQLINEYGTKGANTEGVLNKWTREYRLQYRKVDEPEARQAINARRPVVTRFSLYKEQWDAFNRFYRNTPQGIFEINDLGIHSSLTNKDGHAVVLIKCDPESLTFMNSWGTSFADKGFFKVRNQSVLDLKFYDVYWTLNDLKSSEIAAYQSKTREIGERIARNLPQSVQTLPYECPKCHQCSPAVEFIGHLWEATCPKCNENFKPTSLGLILNSYTH